MISERMKKEMHARNLSIQEFAEMCDLPVDTIKNIYYGKSIDTKLSTAAKIADALQLSVDCLMCKCPHTAAERAIIHNYRSCGKHGKSIIELIARYEASAMKGERERTAKHKIPCILPRGEMHKGIVYDLCETVEIEASIPEAYIAIQMMNNDFAPLYCKDDVLLLENRFPSNGENASFLISDRIYIRKYIEEGKLYRLKCLHKHDEDIILKRMDEIDYIGTIIGVIRE